MRTLQRRRRFPLGWLVCGGVVALGATLFVLRRESVPSVANNPVESNHFASGPDRIPETSLPNDPPVARFQQDGILARISALKPGSDEDLIQKTVADLALCQDRRWIEGVFQRMADQAFAGYLLNRLTLIWARQNPTQTVAWLQGLPAGMERTQAVISAHRLWAESDPRLAVENALQIVASNDRQTTLAATLSVWVQRDLPSASAWIDQFGPDVSLDSAVAEIARMPALIEHHTDVALTWAESITNVEQRKQSLAIILSEWAERDLTAASRYLQETSALSESDKGDLRDSLHL